MKRIHRPSDADVIVAMAESKNEQYQQIARMWFVSGDKRRAGLRANCAPQFEKVRRQLWSESLNDEARAKGVRDPFAELVLVNEGRN